MESIRKVKKLLQKGFCIGNAATTNDEPSMQQQQNTDESDDLDTLSDDFTYALPVYDILPTQIDGRFEECYAQYQEGLENMSNENDSSSDPWRSNMSVLNAYHYKNPAEMNPYIVPKF